MYRYNGIYICYYKLRVMSSVCCEMKLSCDWNSAAAGSLLDTVVAYFVQEMASHI